MKKMRNAIDYKRRRLKSVKDKNSSTISFNHFDKLNFQHQETRAIIYEYEMKLLYISHRICQNCKIGTLDHESWDNKKKI